MQAPLRFHPYLRPVVWGGRSLGTVLNKPLPEANTTYGESWEVSDHPSHRSVVRSGQHAGTALSELMRLQDKGCRHPLLGQRAEAHASFPWLIKFLDACDWLSVQVHPDSHHVQYLWPGEGSKTEAWFILDAAPNSRIYAGLLPGVGEPRLRQALETGQVADCLHQFTPTPGDCVFLPAGTVHAVGGGVLMAEIQQTSDATFRLFDWNRRDAQGKQRQLHIEESLTCLHWDKGPVHPNPVGDYRQDFTRPLSAPFHQSLVECPYFTLEYARQSEPFSLGGTGQLQALIITQGEGQLDVDSQQAEDPSLQPGDTLLLPAALPPVRCLPSPSVGYLLATLP